MIVLSSGSSEASETGQKLLEHAQQKSVGSTSSVAYLERCDHGCEHIVVVGPWQVRPPNLHATWVCMHVSHVTASHVAA